MSPWISASGRVGMSAPLVCISVLCSIGSASATLATGAVAADDATVPGNPWLRSCPVRRSLLCDVARIAPAKSGACLSRPGVASL